MSNDLQKQFTKNVQDIKKQFEEPVEQVLDKAQGSLDKIQNRLKLQGNSTPIAILLESIINSYLNRKKSTGLFGDMVLSHISLDIRDMLIQNHGFTLDFAEKCAQKMIEIDILKESIPEMISERYSSKIKSKPMFIGLLYQVLKSCYPGKSQQFICNVIATILVDMGLEKGAVSKISESVVRSNLKRCPHLKKPLEHYL